MLPEIPNIKTLPMISATHEFKILPIVGATLSYLNNIIFVKRGVGITNSFTLNNSILDLLLLPPRSSLSPSKEKKEDDEQHQQIVFEVFLEGKRSRDRRCVCPLKKGF